MKVLLIQPYSASPFLYPPISILYLASIIRDKGYEVSFIDLRFEARTGKRMYGYENALKNTENCLNTIKGSTPAICGTTVYTGDHSYPLIRLLKKWLPQTKIIVGGPHPTAVSASTLKECSEIDYVVHGEGEKTFLELLSAISNGKGLNNINGIAYKENSSIIVTPSREVVKDLDSLPFPAYDIIPNYNYRDIIPIGKKVMPMFASRGCPYRCNFCFKVLGSKYRKRTPSAVVEEMRMLKIKHSIDEIFFVDALFPLDKKWLCEFFDEIDKNHLKIFWGFETRVDNNLLKEDFYRLKKHGCTMIGFGVESGNEDTLQEIDKRITLEQAYKSVKFAQEAGIATVTFYIFGHKNDNYLKLKNTLKIAKKLNSDFVNFAPLNLYPGTKIFSYLPERMQFDKDGRYILDNLTKSICDVSEKHLWKFIGIASREYFFRFKYFVENILFSKTHPKYLKKKLFIFLVYVFHTLKFAYAKIK